MRGTFFQVSCSLTLFCLISTAVSGQRIKHVNDFSRTRPERSVSVDHGKDQLGARYVAPTLMPGAEALEWTVTPLSVGKSSGWIIRVEAASDGTIHAAGFKSGYPLATWYARREGGMWSTVALLEGRFCDLALDSADRPHILVRLVDDDQYRYHVELLSPNDDGTWQRTPLFTRRSASHTLAFDALDRPHIGYHNSDTMTLYHVYRGSEGWVTEPVVTRASFGYGNDAAYLILDHFDTPHLTWYDFNMRAMGHAVFNGTSYDVREIPGSYGWSMVFDADNHLHMSLVGTVQLGLAHAMFDGSAWSFETVDAHDGDEGAIALDADGNPHIVYGIDRARGPEKLYHAAWNGTEWVVDPEPIATWVPSSNGPQAQDLAVDADNHIHVVFSDDSQDIYYATTSGGGQEPECIQADDCADSEFCNGEEDCVDGVCVAGAEPCPDRLCDELNEACVECLDASHCTDGTFCNGEELCVDGQCAAGDDRCPEQVCDELNRTCVECRTHADCGPGLFCNLDDECVDCVVDADCDDEDMCNGSERCAEYQCVSGEIADCNENGIDDTCDMDGGTSEDCDAGGIPDECERDSEGDGIIDACDRCPESDLSETIVLSDCDTGVSNRLRDDGCTMADLLTVCTNEVAPSMSVRCLSNLTRQWLRDGWISGRENGGIHKCGRNR